MIEVGSYVRATSGNFEGRVLGRHGIASGPGGASEYRSLPGDLNIPVYWVVNNAGEVRLFTDTGIELVSS
ncbi:hypothetical protein QE411_000588 [Microbacterium arborescens]|nr:hypothetical protein [Microbacterium arborescens]